MPLNASTYLTTQGWKGKGTSLDGPNGNGLKKPLVITQKKNLGGIGNDRDRAVEWWDCLFEASAKSIKITPTSSGSTTPSSIPISSILTPNLDLDSSSSLPATTQTQLLPHSTKLSLVAQAKRDHAKRLLMSGFVRGEIIGTKQEELELVSLKGNEKEKEIDETNIANEKEELVVLQTETKEERYEKIKGKKRKRSDSNQEDSSLIEQIQDQDGKSKKLEKKKLKQEKLEKREEKKMKKLKKKEKKEEKEKKKLEKEKKREDKEKGIKKRERSDDDDGDKEEIKIDDDNKELNSKDKKSKSKSKDENQSKSNSSKTKSDSKSKSKSKSKETSITKSTSIIHTDPTASSSSTIEPAFIDPKTFMSKKEESSLLTPEISPEPSLIHGLEKSGSDGRLEDGENRRKKEKKRRKRES